MYKKDLIENLQLLRDLRFGGEPSRVWVQENRQALLQKISEENTCTPVKKLPATKNVLGLLRGWNVAYAFRSTGILAVLVVFVFSSWAAGASAMINTVPGDVLYPVKRAAERAQIAVATTPKARAELRLEFVGRRVNELTKLTADKTSDQGNITEAVVQLRSDVAGVETDLAALKTTEPAVAVSVAKLVDQKSDEFHLALQHSGDSGDLLNATPAVAAIQEAKNVVVDASVKAIAIIIEGRASGSTTVSQKDAASSVDGKIQSVSDRVDTLEQTLSTSTPSSVKESANQAKLALNEAKDRVAKQDLSGALAKVIESKELVKAAETITTAAIEAEAQTALLQNATGTLKSNLVITDMSTSSLPLSVSGTSVIVPGTLLQSTKTPMETATSSDIK